MKIKSISIILAATLLLSSCEAIKSLYTTTPSSNISGSEAIENTTVSETAVVDIPPIETEPEAVESSDLVAIDTISDNTPAEENWAVITEDTTSVTSSDMLSTGTNSHENTIADNAPTKDIEITTDSLVVNTPNYSEKLCGEWLIIKVGDKTIDRDEDMPYIVFQPETSQFYANNGCNTINGQFSLSADDRILFSNTLSTMMYCPDVTFEHDINIIIGDGIETPIKLTQTGAETLLDFIGENNQSIMQLRRSNLEFLNGRWQVETIAGFDNVEPVSEIFIDTAELNVHGNSGCNYFNGDLYLDHRQSNAIDFSNMIVTAMACEYIEQEQAMLLALEQTVSAKKLGNDKIALLDNEGNELMTLTRLPLEK